jgi:hypothetical protein
MTGYSYAYTCPNMIRTCCLASSHTARLLAAGSQLGRERATSRAGPSSVLYSLPVEVENDNVMVLVPTWPRRRVCDQRISVIGIAVNVICE